MAVRLLSFFWRVLSELRYGIGNSFITVSIFVGNLAGVQTRRACVLQFLLYFTSWYPSCVIVYGKTFEVISE